MPRLLPACALILLLALKAASAGTDLCFEAIRQVERDRTTPQGLMTAVALSESGHRDPVTGAAGPWPWTVNNAGDGRYFDSKAEAIAWVEDLQAQGRRNIDVGCMQINLMHHPDAFASLDDALDPATNVAYGARFLAGLQTETGSWERAVERYHTAELERGAAYRSRVYANWQQADEPVQLSGRSLRPRLALASLDREAPALAPSAKFFPIRRGGVLPRGASVPPAQRPARGSRPVVLGPSRAVPGVASLLPVQPAAGPRLPMLAPAPGRIAFLTGAVLGPRAVRVPPLLR